MVVWCESAIFPKHPFRQVQFDLCFISSWCKIASRARNGINSVSQAAATNYVTDVQVFMTYHVSYINSILAARPETYSTAEVLLGIDIHHNLQTVCSRGSRFSYI